MDATFLLSIATLVIKYGAEATMKIIQNWKVENPSEEDFQRLRDMVPDEEFIK